MKYTTEELSLIWLDSFIGLEYKNKSQLYKLIKGKTEIKNALLSEKSKLVKILGENGFNTIINSASGDYLKFILDKLARKDIHVVTLMSKDYPECLKKIPHPPLVLYARGDVSLLSGKNFGIVGSRKSLPQALKFAQTCAKQITESGFNLVTGIAEGVDSSAIIGGLNGTGKVVSVIAGGFDNVYPKTNVDLLEKVVAQGVAISEYPPESVPMPFHFPVRNRIIAGLSKGVLIVSAGKKSGALYTADYAVEYSKDLFAVPYSVGISSGAGCNDLIKKGALLVDDPQDVLSYYGIEQVQQQRALTPIEQAIVTALSDGQMHVEKLCSALGKRIFEITPVLSILEMEGIVVRSSNVYGLVRNGSEE